ncbi:MAG: hypothetical protein ABL958_16465 [Bdellovibrionia bacterium]
MKSMLFSLLLTTLVPTQGSAVTLNGDWTGLARFYSASGNKDFQDCGVQIKQTDKFIDLAFVGSCKSLDSADAPFEIKNGELFLNGYKLGALTKTGFRIDFTDKSQGYNNRLVIDVSVAASGRMTLYKSLNGGGYFEYVVGRFDPR